MLARMNSHKFLSVSDVTKTFQENSGKNKIKAVDGVSFNLDQGETLGIVGETGSGKSTLGRLILNLLEPTSGTVTFNSKNLSSLSTKEMRTSRREMQMIFQDPFSSLDPRMTVGDLIREPLDIHKIKSKQDRHDLVQSTAKSVGLPTNSLDRYPHEFSGGQRQRIAIARAIITNPKLIVADEPVSALDVSIQSQILNLLLELQRKLELTYIFISHDLSVVQHIADKIMVLYLGKVVEFGTNFEIFNNPHHPYTKALISAVPKINPHDRTDRIVLLGDIPSTTSKPPGCHFNPRCHLAMDICRVVEPTLLAIKSDPGHQVSCHLFVDESFTQ